MKNTKAIGGYFDLEIRSETNGFHPDAISLNTGRNAFEYVLKAREIKKMYLPYFTCEVLLEPLKKLKTPFEFYAINEQLEPIFDFSVLENEDGFLYTNYFGLKDNYIKQLSLLCKQLIVDNAQAFYSKPYHNEPTIYSARKFFGVADGAYLYCNEKLEQDFIKDISHDKMSHLLIRKDISAEFGHTSFVANDKLLENQAIKMMSTLTTAILGSIDYELVAKKRIENYSLLNDVLNESNQLSFKLDIESVPMVYPYWSRDKSLRQRLIENKIYTATYWANVKNWCKDGDLENRLTDEVVYLPVDQRYGEKEMQFIVNIINKKL